MPRIMPESDHTPALRSMMSTLTLACERVNQTSVSISLALDVASIGQCVQREHPRSYRLGMAQLALVFIEGAT
jgi:hypothetical protein